tara:strand:- start:1884 stop:2669 length:786 start_codon:yes stop_codon:yes gene_type:complete
MNFNSLNSNWCGKHISFDDDNEEKEFRNKKIIKNIMDDLIDNVVNVESCIIIQKYMRSYLCRKELKKQENKIKEWKDIRENKNFKGIDILDKKTLCELYQTYRNKMIKYHEIEMRIGKYIGRIEGFPDYISENIVLYALIKKNIKCSWNTKSGDIYYYVDDGRVKGEVKCAQNGPSQFSPTSEWDTLFFIDASDHLYGKIKIYMVKNIYNIMQTIKISKTQTVKDQSDQGRRPRSDLNILLSDYIDNDKILFQGKISSLIY